MNKIAEKRRRFEYRRIAVMLERKGMVMNEKKLYWIYREEGLSVRRISLESSKGQDAVRGNPQNASAGPVALGIACDKCTF